MLILAPFSRGQVGFLCFVNVNLASNENSKGQTVFFIVFLTGDPGLASLMKAFLISQCVK